MRILGLDEAGRGSVLGPLVVGAFLYEGEDQSILRRAGADDSKRLSPQKRESTRIKLNALGQGHVEIISAGQIDEGNINTLEINAFIALTCLLKPDKVFLDAPVNPRGIPALQKHLIAQTGVRNWVIEPKADATWPVVGAASIFAKTTRDTAIEALGAVGSGYPSDPITRALLQKMLAEGTPLPDYVRTRWGTLESLRQGSLF